VTFHGATLLVQPGRGPEDTLVAMKPIAEGMGLTWQPQHAKLMAHPVLSKGITEIVIPSAGGPQAMTALPLNRLHFWMATLHPNKIGDPAVRERVIVFQTEAADALFERFFGAAIHSPVTNNEIGRRVAAIVEDKLNRALTTHLQTLLPQMVREQVSAGHHAVVPGISAGEVLEMAGVSVRKGLRGMAGWISTRLRRFHAAKGVAVRLGRLGSRKAYVFDELICRQWLSEGGKAEIEQKLAERRGQGKLHLVTP
jgi:hypothetical protein